MPRFPSGNRGFVSEDNHMTEPKRAQLHLPGRFEFYEFYRVFLPLYRAHREYF